MQQTKPTVLIVRSTVGYSYAFIGYFRIKTVLPTAARESLQALH